MNVPLPIVPPLSLGARISIWPPVVLAPMAGVTNYPYREICRQHGAGLCVSEMISTRGILGDCDKTWKLAQFGAGERPRSIQLFGCEPEGMAEATRRLLDELGVDHIDMNFGCPVPKITKRGMGAAAIEDRANFRRVVAAVVAAAQGIPVTIKIRLGMDEERSSYLDAGRIAQEEGCAWVALHARTARQMYSGRARWEHVAALKATLRIPVLGNGDIFRAEDALRRMTESGCDGVVVGRGCLGNPWLFRDLRRVFEGLPSLPPPGIEERIGVLRAHFDLLESHFSDVPRLPGLFLRKFGAWYVHGLRGAAAMRRDFQKVTGRADLESLLDRILAEYSPTHPGYPADPGEAEFPAMTDIEGCT